MKNKRLTLKDIEEHLRRQDKLAFVPIFVFGCSIFLMAAGLFIQKLSGLDFLMVYLFLLVCGLMLILYASYMIQKSGMR